MPIAEWLIALINLWIGYSRAISRALTGRGRIWSIRLRIRKSTESQKLSLTGTRFQPNISACRRKSDLISSKVDIGPARGIRPAYSAIRTTSLPLFSPENSMLSAPGSRSKPSTTVSSAFSLPSAASSDRPATASPNRG